MSQKALGRLFNTTPAADGAWINIGDQAGGVTFVGYLGGAVGDTYTLQQAKDAAGAGAVNLTAITEFYTSTGNGSDAWVKRTQAAGAAVVAPASAVQQAVVIEVEGTQLADDFCFVKLTSTGNGTVNAIQRDLMVQRDPANLPAVAS